MLFFFGIDIDFKNLENKTIYIKNNYPEKIYLIQKNTSKEGGNKLIYYLEIDSDQIIINKFILLEKEVKLIKHYSIELNIKTIETPEIIDYLGKTKLPFLSIFLLLMSRISRNLELLSKEIEELKRLTKKDFDKKYVLEESEKSLENLFEMQNLSKDSKKNLEIFLETKKVLI